MKRFDLDQHSPGTINLSPGMGIVIITDKGPSRPCGQSMRTTCEHASIHLFPNERSMREAMSGGVGRNGKKQDVRWGVVGEHTTGVIQLTLHEELADELVS